MSKLVNVLFGAMLSDVMTGYRAFSRHFVKTMPLVSRGFEIETQMTLQALYYGYSIREIEVDYAARPAGSESKLRTYHDGFKILLEIVNALKAYRPLLFFGILALFLFSFGLSSLFVSFAQESHSARSAATLCAYISLPFSLLMFGCGLILDTINHRLREISQLIQLRK